MTERHSNLSFAAGALVFPGGLVEKEDRSADLQARCQEPSQLDPNEIAHRLAAIRETFEETGLLFAFDSQGWSIGNRRGANYATTYRAALRAGKISFADFAAKEGLQFAPGDFLHFAHWITPESSPKRFDTQFYLAAAPDGQVATCDGTEAVETIWARPREVLEQARQGHLGLMLPTRLNLEVLVPCRSVHQALKLARTRPIVPVIPEVFERDGETWAKIPRGAGYGVAETRRLDLGLELRDT
jgi:8-oxo-dGTP pyrophosphatase MutT (NUDIX family)